MLRTFVLGSILQWGASTIRFAFVSAFRVAERLAHALTGAREAVSATAEALVCESRRVIGVEYYSVGRFPIRLLRSLCSLLFKFRCQDWNRREQRMVCSRSRVPSGAATHLDQIPNRHALYQIPIRDSYSPPRLPGFSNELSGCSVVTGQ